MTKTFSTIHGLDKRIATDTGMLYTHDNGTASFCKMHTLHLPGNQAVLEARHAADAGASAAKTVIFAKSQFSTMGFCFLYAVKGKSVVGLMKRGRFAQRDVKMLIAEGYTEFFYSNTFTCKLFMLPSGEIVELEKSVDCSPKATTTAALRFGRAMGLV